MGRGHGAGHGIMSAMPLRQQSRALPPLVLAVAILACCGGEPPPPVPARSAPASGSAVEPLSSRDPAPAAPAPPPQVERPDPAEPGLPDLPRLARYVFRVMGERQASCRLENPHHEALGFALRVKVQAGRMTSVEVASAWLEQDGQRLRTFDLAQHPAELQAFVRCLEPSLRALRMSPAPSDGTYDAEYSFPGHPPHGP